MALNQTPLSAVSVLSTQEAAVLQVPNSPTHSGTWPTR